LFLLKQFLAGMVISLLQIMAGGCSGSNEDARLLLSRVSRHYAAPGSPMQIEKKKPAFAAKAGFSFFAKD
jgi:hypothetical protein